MIDIKNATIKDIHKAYKEKTATVTDVVLAYLERIAKIDSCETGLKSVIEINPDALFIAKSLDADLKCLDALPPLFGIPILLKDNINTNDRLHTTAGSVALGDNYAPYDAHVTVQLLEAGAVILGKANMSEFAYYMSREDMPSGYSSRGGQVLNPYNRKETPSGSSSGSAVAVAAGLCVASIGSETSGSIVSPSGQNGIVGIKPTMGLVSRSGVIPISSTHDTTGPMTKTVYDAAVILSVIAGVDPDDSATYAHKFTNEDYTKYCDANGLNGTRIGIVRNPGKEEKEALTEEEQAAFDNLCKVATDAGAILVDNIEISHTNSIMKILHHEFKACLNYYLSTLENSKIKTLKDIIEYNQANAAVGLKYGQSLLLDSENKSSGLLVEPEYLEALLHREQAIKEMDKQFDDNNLDVMLFEAFPGIAPFAGFPSITIPTGQRENRIPTNSIWVARRFDEAALIKVAYAAEQALGINLEPEEMTI